MARRVSISVMLGAVALCAFGGCAGHECQKMGAVSNVHIELPEGWSVNQFCVDAACLGADVLVPNGVTVDDKPGTHMYRFTVVAPDGSETKREGNVDTEKYRVNGPGCDPLTANATLVVAADGTVTAEHP